MLRSDPSPCRRDPRTIGEWSRCTATAPCAGRPQPCSRASPATSWCATDASRPPASANSATARTPSSPAADRKDRASRLGSRVESRRPRPDHAPVVMHLGAQQQSRRQGVRPRLLLMHREDPFDLVTSQEAIHLVRLHRPQARTKLRRSFEPKLWVTTLRPGSGARPRNSLLSLLEDSGATWSTVKPARGSRSGTSWSWQTSPNSSSDSVLMAFTRRLNRRASRLADGDRRDAIRSPDLRRRHTAATGRISRLPGDRKSQVRRLRSYRARVSVRSVREPCNRKRASSCRVSGDEQSYTFGAARR